MRWLGQRVLWLLACNASVIGSAVAAPIPEVSAQQLYARYCATCHAPGWDHPGYNRLRERGGVEPDLSARRDLTRDYVQVVVSRGIGSMPAFLPTRLSDAEVALIADYLARKQ